MDTNNLVVRLCIEGTRAEFDGQTEKARMLFHQAWEAACDNYEACIAAHYMARHQDSLQDVLYWNEVALLRANAVGDERVQGFFPSLYVNLGHSHEMLGNLAEAERYFKLAADLGLEHQVG